MLKGQRAGSVPCPPKTISERQRHQNLTKELFHLRHHPPAQWGFPQPHWDPMEQLLSRPAGLLVAALVAEDAAGVVAVAFAYGEPANVQRGTLRDI